MLTAATGLYCKHREDAAKAAGEGARRGSVQQESLDTARGEGKLQQQGLQWQCVLQLHMFVHTAKDISCR
mgnify:CR=1